MNARKEQRACGQVGLSPSLRRFLYLTAAVTGGAVMIVEILGAKMLAPFVGTSHFVWTAQIAVTLIALATGYYLGGRLVDRMPDLKLLYAAIMAASVYLAGTVLVVEPLAYWCLRFRLAVGSLLASLLLFFVPLSLLAMVGPFLVRMITESLSAVGRNAGRLTSVSTLGSVVGTVLIGYVLIPLLPNSVIMYVTALVLLATGVAYFVFFGRLDRPLLAALILLMAVIGISDWVARSGSGLRRFASLYRANSNFGELHVIENREESGRYFLNDFLIQNTYDPKEKKSMSAFTYLLQELALAYAPGIERALCIGMGMGVVPGRMAAAGVKVDVVEINPALPAIAARFFDCDTNRFNLVIGDGRCFVNRAAPGSYDAIVLDAFLGDSIPTHLFSRESFSAMRRILRPGGVLVINSFGSFDSGRDYAMASLEKTLREGAGFRQVKVHAYGSGNVFFVASMQDELKICRQPVFEEVHTVCRDRVKELFMNLRPTVPAHGVVLRDDFNPLEYHDAANREETRHSLAMSMRNF